MKRWLFFLMLALIAAIGLYALIQMNWSYSNGERAGWVQKLSRKGWLCKTWEGEMVMVTMPGTVPEKFEFTVWDPQVVSQINQSMGRRVALTYEQKKGLPSTCFGDTEYWVTAVQVAPDLPLIPGAVPNAAPSQAAPAQQPAPPPAQQTAPPPTQQMAPPPAPPPTQQMAPPTQQPAGQPGAGR